MVLQKPEVQFIFLEWCTISSYIPGSLNESVNLSTLELPSNLSVAADEILSDNEEEKKKCKFPAALKRHQANFKCEKCSFQTDYLGKLNKHLSLKHGIYECDQCDFRCNDSKNLTSHIRKVHAIDDKCYQCDRCDFSTFHKQALIYHIAFENRCFQRTIVKLHCDLCKGFEAISPFDIIHHLKEFHVKETKIPLVKLTRLK